MRKKILILGTGLTALMGAYFAKKKWMDASVTLLKTGDTFGGNLRGFKYENGLYFDIGTHIFQESGIRDIDDTLFSSIPATDLILYEVGCGDLVGGLYNGALQTTTHFPTYKSDAAKLGIDRAIGASEDLAPIDRFESARSVGVKRFGEHFTDETLKPILESMYKIPIDRLSSFAMLLPGLTRVAAPSIEDWMDHHKNEKWRAIYGIPDQRKLPFQYQNSNKSFYSKRNGTRSFIDGLIKKITGIGVQIVDNIKELKIDTSDSKVVVHLQDEGDLTYRYNAIFSGLGAVGFAKFVGLDLSTFGLDRPLPHTLINIASNKPFNADCFYFYGFESQSSIYRATNYEMFSPPALQGLSRMTIEVLGNMNKENLLTSVLDELAVTGILEKNALVFSATEFLSSGFPSPTISNFNGMQKLANYLDQTMPDNIYLGGAGHGGGYFFQNEVLSYMHKLIERANV